MLVFAQSILAGVGLVRSAGDVALDERLLAVVCSHDGPFRAADAPQGETHDGLCCVLGCPMGAGFGLATLPDQPILQPTMDMSASRVEPRREHREPSRRPPHVFGARAPPALMI